MLSINWGFDPTKIWTFDGLGDTYKSGEQITFGVKFQGFGIPCSWPEVDVKQDNKTVWTSKLVALSCHSYPKSQLHYSDVEWKTGLDSDHIGNLVLNQTGTYSVSIDHLPNGKSLQKNITVVS